VPAGKGVLRLIITESISKPREQEGALALLTVLSGVSMRKSLPSSARVLQRIFLLSFKIIFCPSQYALAAESAGILGSVMFAVPPPKLSL